MDQVHIATLKLTGWYLAVLMAVCIVFSTVIYEVASREFDRPIMPGSSISANFSIPSDVLRDIREQRASQAKSNVLGNLLVLNAITLMIGACASYLFARRTLLPVEHAMTAQSRFTSDASHELRTPLAVMRTENEIALREKKPSIQKLSQIIESNLEEIERLQLLTDRLLALSSNQPLVFTTFSVGEAAHSAALRHTTAAKQQHITLNVTAADLTAYGDSETVSDIISILIDNAIKYSPKDTTVTVAAHSHGSGIDLTVADQGNGISGDDIEHIFDRFYRADQSRSKDIVEGHGLGLALARRLSELNHATLTVTNRAPNGAVFTLRLNKPKK